MLACEENSTYIDSRLRDAQWLRAMAVLAQNPDQFLAPGTPVPGDLIPKPGLHEFQAHTRCTNIQTSQILIYIE